jgi:hypothetical protein
MVWLMLECARVVLLEGAATWTTSRRIGSGVLFMFSRSAEKLTASNLTC